MTRGDRPLLVVAAAIGVVGAVAVAALAAAPGVTEEPTPEASSADTPEPRRTSLPERISGPAKAVAAAVPAVAEVDGDLEAARRLLARERATVDVMYAQGEDSDLTPEQRRAAQLARNRLETRVAQRERKVAHLEAR